MTRHARGMCTAAASAIVLASATFVSSAHADEPPSPRVVDIFGATSDAFEAAEIGEELWVATSGGLAIADVKTGRITSVRTSKDGVLGTRLRSISVLPEGVWLGGVDGATLVSRDGKPVRTVPLPRVRRVVQHAGVRYAATADRGLVRIDDAGRIDRVATVSMRVPITDLLSRPDGLWIATAGAGVMRLDASGKPVATFRAASGLVDDVVWDLEAKGDRVYAATAAGISVVGSAGVDAAAAETAASKTLAIRDVRSIVPAGDHVWLAATFGGGVERLSAKGSTAFGPAQRARSVVRLASGNVVVLHERGATSIDTSGRVTSILDGGLPSADITALADDGNGALWIGTFDRGLARLENDRVRSVASGASGVDARVNDIAVRNGEVFVATDSGLFIGRDGRFARATDPSAPPREHVTALHVDAKSRDVWVASAHGVSRLSGTTWARWTNETHGLPTQLNAITTDARGTVWIGGVHGLARFSPDKGNVEIHRASSGDLPVDWVTACVPWDQGLAVGTYNGGIAFFAANGDRRIVREADGLPSGWVNPHAARVVGGALWLGTLDRGLVVGSFGKWRKLGLGDGLPSADVTAVLPAGEHRVWIATRGGLARVAY